MIYSFNLTKKVVLVTGGYGHLGKAITQSMAYHGATVFVLGRDKKKFDDAFEETSNGNANIHFQSCDISSSTSIRQAFETVIVQQGTIDVLINNAAYLQGQSPEKLTDEDWSICMDGTLGSTFKCIREIIPHYKKKGSGKIINVSSMYGIVAPDFSLYDSFPAFLNPPHYGAAKAGIIQLTKYYASYLGKYGITVNAVTPGPFPAEAVQQTQGFVEQLAAKTCLGKIGKAEDVAGAFVFLASDAAAFVTGQNIIVDGGWTIK